MNSRPENQVFWVFVLPIFCICIFLFCTFGAASPARPRPPHIGTVMLNHGAPPGHGSDSDNGKRRKKRSDARNDAPNANGKMSATVIEFVKATDALASVLHAVTTKKLDDSKSRGKGKGRKDNKMVPSEKASKMMKAFGFGVPKELCGRNDIGTKLMDDPEAKKQIIMFP